MAREVVDNKHDLKKVSGAGRVGEDGGENINVGDCEGNC